MRSCEVGQAFGRLTVTAVNSNGTAECTCICGNTRKPRVRHLLNGKTRSCGCLHKEQLANRVRTHGASDSLTWRRWRSMKARCEIKGSKSFPAYGGAGITVCERWSNSFANFLGDMGECPDESMTLDRLDNAIGYQPGNCRWATKTAQNRNSSRNHLIEHGGKKLCVSEWAEITGIKYRTIMTRLAKGWSAEAALTTPVKPSGRAAR